MRELALHELDAVSGGGATVTYYDNDRDGKLSDGDTIVQYEMDGNTYTPDQWNSMFDNNTVDWGDVTMGCVWGMAEGGTTGFFAGLVGGAIVGGPGGAGGGAMVGAYAGMVGGCVYGAYESYAEQSGLKE